DLSEEAAVEALWRRASHRRHIDILVNNAGLGYNGPFAAEDFARERASVMVNVVALTILTKRAVSHMLKQGGGRILNVASLAAFMPGPNMAVYHATKALVLALDEAVAEELHGRPGPITTLCPGPTATNFARDAAMEGITLFRMLPVPSAAKVARAGWQAMLAGRRRRVPGAINGIFALAPRLSPLRLTTWITKHFLR